MVFLVVLYFLDKKAWKVLADGKWIILYLLNEDDIRSTRLIAKTSESEFILNSVIQVETEWALGSDDFGEFKTPGEPRYGFHFISYDAAISFSEAIYDVIVKRKKISNRYSSPEKELMHPVLNQNVNLPGHRRHPRNREIRLTLSQEELNNEILVKTKLFSNSAKKSSHSASNSSLIVEISDSPRQSLKEGWKDNRDKTIEANKTDNLIIESNSRRLRRPSNELDVDRRKIVPMAKDDEDGDDDDARYRVLDIDTGVLMDIRSLDAQMTPDQRRYTTLTAKSPQQKQSVEEENHTSNSSTSLNTKQRNNYRRSIPPRPSHSPELADTDPISSPTDVLHTVRVFYNEDRARFEGLESLPPVWGSMNVQFGLDYNASPKKVVRGYDFRIPAVLDLLKRTLLKHEGHKVDGIFRLAPDKEECQVVKRQINSGQFEDCDDPHIIANLIKMYFREMPGEGLLDGCFDLTAILRITTLPIPDVALELMAIKEPNKSLLYWVLDLMVEVIQFESLNRMSARNMAIVMSPNLFAMTTTSTSRDTSKNATQALVLSQQVTEFLTKLLECALITRCQHHELHYDNPNLV